MPLKFWCEAFHTSVHIINRLPTPILNGLSLIQQLFGKIPDYLSLKTFGCACFPCIQPYQKQKFQFHSIKCVFLGYIDTHKGYKCVSSTSRLYISRHFIFNELEFPFEHGFLNTKQVESSIVINSSSWLPTLSVPSFPTPINHTQKKSSNQLI